MAGVLRGIETASTRPLVAAVVVVAAVVCFGGAAASAGRGRSTSWPRRHPWELPAVSMASSGTAVRLQHGVHGPRSCAPTGRRARHTLAARLGLTHYFAEGARDTISGGPDRHVGVRSDAGARPLLWRQRHGVPRRDPRLGGPGGTGDVAGLAECMSRTSASQGLSLPRDHAAAASARTRRQPRRLFKLVIAKRTRRGAPTSHRPCQRGAGRLLRGWTRDSASFGLSGTEGSSPGRWYRPVRQLRPPAGETLVWAGAPRLAAGALGSLWSAEIQGGVGVMLSAVRTGPDAADRQRHPRLSSPAVVRDADCAARRRAQLVSGRCDDQRSGLPRA